MGVEFNPNLNYQKNLFTGSPRVEGTGFNPQPKTSFGQSQGMSAAQREVADASRFFGANNGTGNIQPKDAPADSKLQFLYA